MVKKTTGKKRNWILASIHQLLRKHPVINLSINKVIIGLANHYWFSLKLGKQPTDLNPQDPYGPGIKISKFNNLLRWMKLHPSRLSIL